MSTILVILFFALTIFIHELGHFLFARKNGMKVNIFSIGFGPRLWKIYTDKKGTEYRLSLIPLGGYVSIEGQSDIPSAQNLDKKDFPKNHFYSKTPWQRIQVIVAGVIMNFIFAIFLFVVAFLIGIPVISNSVGSVDESLNEKLRITENNEIKIGDKIIAIDGKKVDKWEDVVTFVATSDKKEVNITLERKGEKINFKKVPLKKILVDRKRDLVINQLAIYPERNAVILTNDYNLPEGAIIKEIRVGDQVKKNIIGINSFIQKNIGKKIELVYQNDQEILTTNLIVKEREVIDAGYSFASRITPLENSVAKKNGLKNGDLITRINDTPISSWDNIVSFFYTIKKRTKLTIIFQRDGEEKIISFFPNYSYEQERVIIGVAPYQVKTEKGNGYEIASISPAMQSLKPGVRKGDILISTASAGESFSPENAKAVSILKRKSSFLTIQYPIKNLIKKEGFLFPMKQENKILKYSFVDSVKESFFMIYKKITETISFLKQLILGNLSLKALSGPVGIFKASYDIVQYDLIYFLFFLGQINVLLAFTNLLPIPVLDGGHLVFTVYELITKKRVPHKLYYALHMLGFMLMMTLTLYVIFNDIKYF